MQQQVNLRSYHSEILSVSADQDNGGQQRVVSRGFELDNSGHIYTNCITPSLCIMWMCGHPCHVIGGYPPFRICLPAVSCVPCSSLVSRVLSASGNLHITPNTITHKKQYQEKIFSSYTFFRCEGWYSLYSGRSLSWNNLVLKTKTSL